MTAPIQGRETRAGESTPDTNERAEGFLAPPKAGPGNPGGELTEAGGERPGAVIDRYVLLERLGEGGFGSVWRAEQRHPVVRPVALKIIKLGMDTRQVIARFEAERQALALMDHSNIARVFDAGATETGRPYFVMELVAGEPITLWCNENSLSIRQRLELFVQVCQAVQHAHTKGVIHRDLKPSNVLVSLQDGEPSVKVIDFGIAKATSARLTEKTLFTEHRQFVGTPEYMSPEQAGGSVDIDTRTDVYSLGVLLYELLAGGTPFDSRSLRVSAYDEIQRIIREVDPPRPSTRLSQAGETLATLAVQRQADPAKLPRLIRGDLDWIVMKALEKDRSRRYETASALGMDVQRHLSGEEVLAAPPSAVYRMRKFVARNRVPAIAASLVAAALVIGVLGTSIALVHANRQRQLAEDAKEGEALQRRRAQENEQAAIREARRAETEAQRARDAEEEAQARAREIEQVADFQADMLGGIDPAQAGIALMSDIRRRFAEEMARAGVPESERLARLAALETELGKVNFTDAAAAMIERNMLEPAMTAIDLRFADQPLVAGSLRYTLASVYSAMGRYEEALALQRESLELCREVLGEEHPYTMRCANAIGYLLLSLGRLEEAEPEIREALESSIAALGEEHEATIVALNNLGALLETQGKLRDAEAVHRDCLDRLRRKGMEESEAGIRSMINLAAVLRQLQDPQEAESLLRRASELSLRSLGSANRLTLRAEGNLGVLLGTQGRFAEAEALQRRILATCRQLFGEEHHRTLEAMYALSATLSQSDPAQSEAFCREVLEKCRKALGNDHRLTGMALNNLGQTLRRQGRHQDAEPLLREALLTQRRIEGDEHPNTLAAMVNLARLFEQLNRPAEAEALYGEAFAKARATLGEDHEITYKAVSGLAKGLVARRRFGEAESLLRASVQGSRRVQGEDHPETLAVTWVLVDVVSRLNKPAESETLCRELLERQRRVLGNEHPDTLRSLLHLALLLRNRGQPAEAEPLSAEAADAYRKVLGAEAPLSMIAMDHLAQALVMQGKFVEAEPIYRQVCEGRARTLGHDHPQTLMSLRNLGKNLRDVGKPAEAEPYLRDALERHLSKLGKEAPATAEVQLALGQVLTSLGRFADAEPLLLAAEEVMGRERSDRAAQDRDDAIVALITLYERWHAAEPEAGHDEQAAAWQARREALAATTKPATREAATDLP